LIHSRVKNSKMSLPTFGENTAEHTQSSLNFIFPFPTNEEEKISEVCFLQIRFFCSPKSVFYETLQPEKEERVDKAIHLTNCPLVWLVPHSHSRVDQHVFPLERERRRFRFHARELSHLMPSTSGVEKLIFFARSHFLPFYDREHHVASAFSFTRAPRSQMTREWKPTNRTRKTAEMSIFFSHEDLESPHSFSRHHGFARLPLLLGRVLLPLVSSTS